MMKMTKRGIKGLIIGLLLSFTFVLSTSAEEEIQDIETMSEKQEEDKEEAVVKSVKTLNPSLETVNYIYDGGYKKPKVIIEDNGKALVLNKDYKVSYESCKEVGEAKAIVTGIGDYNDTVTLSYDIKLGKITSGKTEARTYNSILVKWNAVPGADGYIIYRSTASAGEFKNVGQVTNKSARSFADKDLKFDKTYYYKIRAYRVVSGKKVYGEYTEELKQKVMLATLGAPSSKAESYNSIKLSWKKVDGADGYVVYRGISKNGSYNKIGTVKGKASNTYTDKKCSCGKSYYYKVRAYRKVGKTNVYADYSSSKAAKTVPEKIEFSKTCESFSNKVVLKWDKSSGATGYEIYRKTSPKSKYVRVKTVTKGSTVRWTNTGLAKKKIYYYRIRPYRTVNGEKVYGAYSDAYKKSNKGGWKYKNGYKLYYDSKGKLVKDVEKIIGKQSSYVIKVNKRKNVVTVYAKDGNKGYIIPVKSFVCSTGYATPTGTFYTPAKYRWHTLMGPSYGQWDTRVVGGILFHSVFYSRPNNSTLSVSAYNKLGTTASHGCIRLTAADAKWIYDNCKLKTKVIIYNSSSSGPFGKPKAKKLPSWHTWDPTDPTAKGKCRQRGCH